MSGPPRPPTVTAGVIAGDEERHIAACLASIRWADEVVVLHSGRDRTTDLAGTLADRVAWRAFDNYAAQRQALLELATGDWIFFVDADERASADLAKEIRAALARPRPESPVGYWVPRRNYFWGHWVRGGGWYPDYQLRLFRRDRGRYDPDRHVHELVLLDGPAGHLRNTLTHYNYDSLGHFIRKQRAYAALEASQLHARGVRARPRNLVLQPLREFRRRFVSLRGFRDGWLGLLLAGLTAYYTLTTYARLLRLGARR